MPGDRPNPTELALGAAQAEGCWCATRRKRCEIHAAYEDGAEAALAAQDREVARLREALRQECRCNDPDETPPTSWCDGEPRPPIPHHVDCVLYTFELPDEATAPNARAHALTRAALSPEVETPEGDER